MTLENVPFGIQPLPSSTESLALLNFKSRLWFLQRATHPLFGTFLLYNSKLPKSHHAYCNQLATTDTTIVNTQMCWSERLNGSLPLDAVIRPRQNRPGPTNENDTQNRRKLKIPWPESQKHFLMNIYLLTMYTIRYSSGYVNIGRKNNIHPEACCSL